MGITDDELLELAGPGPFDRGYDYYRNGRVIEIETRNHRTVAAVSGTKEIGKDSTQSGLTTNGEWFSD